MNENLAESSKNSKKPSKVLPGRVILRRPKFLLRGFTVDDVLHLVRLFGHPAVTKGARGKVWHYTHHHAQKYVREKLKQYQRSKPRVVKGEFETMGYAIEIDGQLAGGVRVTLDKKEADIGYWLAKPYWGQGIMTSVVGAWTKYLFAHIQIDTIEARVFPFNPASAQVLLKNKFVFVARETTKNSDRLLFSRPKKIH
jgi:RimJ/RimL family protein N-acetyltransferase